MKKGEVALFTLPADGEGDVWRDSNSVLQFEVELLSWIRVVDVCKDGGVLKKIMEKGSGNDHPADLDEVLGSILPLPFACLCFFLFPCINLNISPCRELYVSVLTT